MIDAARTLRIVGLEKPAFPLALGFEFFDTLDEAAPTLDRYASAGGNVFDTAFIYANGHTEAIFGEWHSARGVPRDDIVLIGKGAHTPLCTPEAIGAQLAQSLERLRTDHVDVYLMHRDDPAAPVGEFVDAIDAEVGAGRIRGIVGGSNWTRERLDAANDYAAREGRTGFSAMSNNFCLADMLDAIWPGCVSASDAAWREWQSRSGLVNFAWSSQGRGFFTERAAPDRHDDAELVRVWYSNENFARRERAIAMAGELGCSPIQIALAYALSQPFPVVPLIGPRKVAELDESLAVADLRLNSDQLDWLRG